MFRYVEVWFCGPMVLGSEAGCCRLLFPCCVGVKSVIVSILHVVPSHLGTSSLLSTCSLDPLLLFSFLFFPSSFSLLPFSSSFLQHSHNPTSTTTTVMKLALSVNKPLNGHTFQAADKVSGRVDVQLDDLSETPEVKVIFQGESFTLTD